MRSHVNAHLDEIPGGTGLGAYDRPVAPDQPVEQRALTRVGFAEDDGGYPLAEQCARAFGREHAPGSRQDRGDALLQPPAVLRREILVGEIDLRLDGGQDAQDPIDKFRHVTPERSAKHLARGSEGALAASVYEVHDRLRLAQVHAPVEERSLREFPGTRRPASTREKVRQNLLGYEGASVAGNLERVLACI